MKINLTDLAKNQIQLDKYIFIKNNTTKEKTFDNRIMALLVEIGETANEIKFFKFWSQKKASSNEVVLEEFIDIIHFVISLGLTINYKKWNLNFKNNFSLDEAFFNLYESTINFKNNNLEKNFEKILISLFSVGDCLNFDPKNIFEMYQKKNKINFKRQNSNY